jgi:hypothetical protein
LIIAIHRTFRLICGLRWLREAVDDRNAGVAVLITAYFDLLDEQPDEFAPLLNRLFGVLFNLRDPLREAP